MLAQSYTREALKCVLRKLKATWPNGQTQMAIVTLDNCYQARLFLPPHPRKLSPFMVHKWRQRLLLQEDEFSRLARCTLDGDDALNASQRRLNGQQQGP